MMIFERPHQRRERQRGATIIEAIGALGVLALVSVGLTAWIDSQQSQARAHFAGLELDLMRPHAHEVAAQAVAGSLQDGTGQALVLDAANPVIALALPHATVAASVPAKGSTTNGFGHAYCLLLERQADGQIGSLLLTLGGRDMNEGQLADAVSFAGPAAGRLQLSGGTLQAFSAHWARGIGSDAAAVVQASCGQPPAPGHLAALTRYEQGVGGTGQALYRVKVDVSDETAAGRELNTMQHDLSIRGDLVLGLKDVIQEGGTCTPGTHGRTAQGVALECPMATSVWTPLASDTGRSIVGSRLAGDALGLEAAGTQGFDVYTTACPRVGAMRRDEEGGVMACQTAKTDCSGALAWKRVGGAVIKWLCWRSRNAHLQLA